MELVDERAGLNKGWHTSLDGGDDYGIGLGHAISIDGHETRNSSGRGNPLQLLFAGRFRPTSACCPLANGAEGSPEPLRLQATPEFSAIATAAAPLALKEQIVCVERALPRSEHVGSPATQRLSNEIATMPPAADNLFDRQAVEIEALARQDQACSRLMTVPGIGPIISSAMVAAIGTGDVFSKGRDFGAWLGLVPKQISTGDRTILGKISRRGNRSASSRYCSGVFIRQSTKKTGNNVAPKTSVSPKPRSGRPDRGSEERVVMSVSGAFLWALQVNGTQCLELPAPDL